jgi:hypothetical protein
MTFLRRVLLEVLSKASQSGSFAKDLRIALADVQGSGQVFVARLVLGDLDVGEERLELLVGESGSVGRHCGWSNGGAWKRT